METNNPFTYVMFLKYLAEHGECTTTDFFAQFMLCQGGERKGVEWNNRGVIRDWLIAERRKAIESGKFPMDVHETPSKGRKRLVKVKNLDEFRALVEREKENKKKGKSHSFNYSKE